jgi:hypothetical protein
MKATITLLLFLISLAGYGQIKPLTKKELRDLIKHEIITDEKNHFDSWIICNGGDAYVKNDTLQLHGNTNLISAGCSQYHYIRWKFTSIRKMYQNSTTIKGHATIESTVPLPKDFYTIKMRQKGKKLILKRYNKHKLIDCYEVLGNSATDTLHPILTIVRLPEKHKKL